MSAENSVPELRGPEGLLTEPIKCLKYVTNLTRTYALPLASMLTSICVATSQRCVSVFHRLKERKGLICG